MAIATGMSFFQARELLARSTRNLTQGPNTKSIEVLPIANPH